VLADTGIDLEGKTIADVQGIERNPDAADFGVVSNSGCCGNDRPPIQKRPG
jgi:hypothetical protein